MTDLISRADAIDAVLTYFIPRSHTGERGEHEEDFVRTIFKELPSAEAVQGAGRYENAMQKLREMPRYLNGVKEKQITKISDDAVPKMEHDRMTREEAKEILTHNWTRVDNPNYSESELDEAFFMAIEALQTIDNCDQCEWCCPSDGIPTIHVVRCKDCLHANECHKSVQYTRHELNTVTIGYSPIEWCSRGERREP